MVRVVWCGGGGGGGGTEGGERVDCWPNKTGVDTKSDRQCGGIQRAHRPVPPQRQVPGQHVRVQDRPGDCWRWARVGP